MQESINGVEKKPLPHMLAMTNMMLHGIDVPTKILHDNTLSRPRERATADPIRHLPSSWCNNAIHSNFQSAPEYRAVMTGERSSDLLKSSTILNISCTPPKQTRRAIARRSSRSDEGGAKKAARLSAQLPSKLHRF
jgi:hypothetical protein